jgi:anti-sigma factor RsiW
MSCEYRTREYVEYLTGELSESARGQLEKHAGGCVRCRAELEAYSRLIQGLESLPEKAPPRDLTASILRAVFHRPASRRRRIGALERVLAVAAASGLLATFLISIRGLGGRAASSAWSTLTDGYSGFVNAGRDAIVLLTSLSKVVDAAGSLVTTVAGALNAALFKAPVPTDALFFIAAFMMLTTALLWRLVGHPIPKPGREVHHAHS